MQMISPALPLLVPSSCPPDPVASLDGAADLPDVPKSTDSCSCGIAGDGSKAVSGASKVAVT
jgi:hypothetical protein